MAHLEWVARKQTLARELKLNWQGRIICELLKTASKNFEQIGGVRVLLKF